MQRQLLEYHATIGYRFIPGLKTREPHEAGGFLLRTNQAGYRCRHEFSASKRPGTFRILLFGDSYTAGMGVSDKDRYAEVLEDLLPGVEVYNFGLPGTGTDQQYLSYCEDAAHLERDLVVIAIMVENIRRVAARYRPYATLEGEEVVALAKPYFELADDGSLKLHHVPVPKSPLPLDSGVVDVDAYGRFVALRRLVDRLGPRVKDRLQRWSRFQPLPAYDRRDHPDWRLMKAIVEKWVSEVRTPVIVVPIPLFHYVEKTASAKGYQARFRELEQPPDVVVHDPLPDFHRFPHDERRAFRFLHDCHLTPSAHRVVAESLAARIAPLLRRQGGVAA